ncbi:PREDICTED: cactin-like [Amphimedon queenslandica]|uniref:Splicing factor Cactin n=1 Tax=Amphimedon queenslandica TaxID=400682 RepID=A0A1X7U0M7_AMPQE|nr:PREDICTED: cactin-like [Amphimedon queenslandica]|eukprot:XP_019856665.1 PREDICTED: cactin-like [Amphimedon queenslandica]
MPKTKHHHHRHRSPSTSPSRSPSPLHKRKHRKKEQAEKERAEKKKQKELMKALETPEEKRLRRIKKKEEKDKRKRAEMGWDQEMMGYTNADNPFGDQHLLDTFVWHKKREKEAEETKVSAEELERREKRRQVEMKTELEKVKKRRIEREKEREAREEEMALLQRMKEADMFKEWENQEDDFHLEQAKLRSKVRIEGGRAKPIDLLAKYINTTDDDMDIEMQEPYHLLRGLNIVDLEDLLEDMKVYIELEGDVHTDYWKDMLIICEDEIAKLKKLELLSIGSKSIEHREGMHSSVSTDVAKIFKGKTYGELIALETQISAKINSRNPGDVTWWETALQQLKAHIARTRLRDKHQAALRKKLFQLKQEQAEQFGITDTPLFPSAGPVKVETEQEEGEKAMEGGGGGENEEETDSKQLIPVELGEPEPSSQEAEKEESDTLIAEEDLLQLAYDEYESSKYSPKLLKAADIKDEVELIDYEVDVSIRESERRRILSGDKSVTEYGKINMSRTVSDDGSTNEEYDFNSEITLDPQQYVWQGKYRPRKPRFFNRVHTGFEWNKYNQTHYDVDNPPPKIVQGYKFNIFYPDLINKSQAPTYTVTPIKDNPDFAVLQFHAGPPYEDIAFKIVNREWEYSWKYGFTCQFNNNILQLWFRFKRYRYRR